MISSSPFPTSYDSSHPDEAPVSLPSAPRRAVAGCDSDAGLFLQPPLSRRGRGPGIIMFLPPAAPSGTLRAQTLDPEPVHKWAEEGFAIVGIPAGASSPDTVGHTVQAAVEALKGASECTTKDKFAVLVYDPAVVESLCQFLSSSSGLSQQLCVLASYGGSIPSDCPIPAIEHTFPSAADSTTAPDLACPVPDDDYDPYTEQRRSYEYLRTDGAPASAFAVLPEYGDDVYDHSAASLAHTRTLSFLKPRIGGPWFDLERIWDQHTWYEFVGRSVAKTMGTMVDEPYVNHIPTMIGGVGRAELTAFYRDHFIFSNPPDAALSVVSRTVGIDRIVDEFIFSCTHSTEWSWFLPGIPPSHRQLRVPFIAVVCIRGDRLYHEHIWWDHASALKQCGALPSHVPLDAFTKPDVGKMMRLPVAGAEGAEKLLSENKPSNEMLEPGWKEGP